MKKHTNEGARNIGNPEDEKMTREYFEYLSHLAESVCVDTDECDNRENNRIALEKLGNCLKNETSYDVLYCIEAPGEMDFDESAVPILSLPEEQSPTVVKGKVESYVYDESAQILGLTISDSSNASILVELFIMPYQVNELIDKLVKAVYVGIYGNILFDRMGDVYCLNAVWIKAEKVRPFTGPVEITDIPEVSKNVLKRNRYLCPPIFLINMFGCQDCFIGIVTGEFLSCYDNGFSRTFIISDDYDEIHVTYDWTFDKKNKYSEQPDFLGKCVFVEGEIFSTEERLSDHRKENHPNTANGIDFAYLAYSITVLSEIDTNESDGRRRRIREKMKKQRKADNLDSLEDLRIDDPVRLYIEEINKIPLLPQEEEIDLTKRAAFGDKGAKKILITSNLRLALDIAQKYSDTELLFSDLIAEANMGLIKAADNYQYLRDNSFAAYAAEWIHVAVTEAVAAYNTKEQEPGYDEDNFRDSDGMGLSSEEDNASTL